MYTEDGLERPLYLTLNTPLDGNVVRIINTGPVEFPLTASVVRPRFRADFRTLERKQLSCVCEQIRSAY